MLVKPYDKCHNSNCLFIKMQYLVYNYGILFYEMVNSITEI